jgi:hypothetical protein
MSVSLFNRLWRGDVPIWRVLGLWGFAANRAYTMFFFLWPLRLMSLVGERRIPGLLLGALFLIISGSYLIFSFAVGLRTALNRSPRPVDVQAGITMPILVAFVLLILGECLWILFAWYWLSNYPAVWM